jgi:hypothetical protein
MSTRCQAVLVNFSKPNPLYLVAPVHHVPCAVRRGGKKCCCAIDFVNLHKYVYDLVSAGMAPKSPMLNGSPWFMNFQKIRMETAINAVTLEFYGN